MTRPHRTSNPIRKPVQLDPVYPSPPQARRQTPGTGSQRGGFLEIFAGSGNLTAAVGSLGKATFSPMDIKNGHVFDLRRRSTQLTVLAWIKSQRVSWVHLGTPCTVYSKARRFLGRLDRAREKERVGLELALFTAEVIDTCRRYKVKWSLENPQIQQTF